MKLRIRSLETNTTHKIELPDTCTLHQLKQSIFNHIHTSSSSSSLILSLNKKDELYAESPSPQDVSIQSLGITSGDLIYFSLNPFAFSSPHPSFNVAQMDETLEIGGLNNTRMDKTLEIGGLNDTQMDKTLETNNLSDTQMGNFAALGENVVLSDKNQEFGVMQMKESSQFRNRNDKSDDFSELVDTQMEKSVRKGDPDGENDVLGDSGGLENVGASKSSNLTDHSDDFVDKKSDSGGETPCLDDFEGIGNARTSTLIEGNDGVGEMEVVDESVLDSEAKFSVPSFLKKVFVKEVGDVANGGAHKILVIAVHAVLIESGFVAYDPMSGMKIDGFHLSDEWPSSAFGLSLHYTLPEIASSEVVDTVVVKFQMLGKYVNVYGNLPMKGFRVHRVCLDEPRFVSALNFVWKMSDIDSKDKNNEPMKLDSFKEIFEFWKIVKDGLSYPLLIELCEKTGLPSPPCLMCLPTELKLKILESASAVDVAKVGCTCSELRFLCSNNDLWKLKYEEEFGKATSSQGECQWKAKFASAWETRWKRKRLCIPYPFREPRLFNPIFPGRRNQNPRGNPFVIGGDYDRLPALGVPPRYGGRLIWRNSEFGGFGF